MVEIIAQRRVGGPSIFDLIQAGLYDKFAKQDLPMALGGVFYSQNSGAQANVLVIRLQNKYIIFKHFSST